MVEEVLDLWVDEGRQVGEALGRREGERRLEEEVLGLRAEVVGRR